MVLQDGREHLGPARLGEVLALVNDEIDHVLALDALAVHVRNAPDDRRAVEEVRLERLVREACLLGVALEELARQATVGQAALDLFGQRVEVNELRRAEQHALAYAAEDV